MSKVIPWSYSSLTGYETCPHKYHAVRIAKTVPGKTFSEADEGVKRHKDIEHYLKGEFPLKDAALKKLVDNTLAPYNPKFYKYEHKLAITKDRAPCDWNDPNCYHRGVIDVMYVDPNSNGAAIFDWKNGKVNLYSQQLVANSICLFAHYPHVDRVNTEYVWMKFGKTTPAKVYRDNIERTWIRFVKRADELEAALAENNWPKRPSGLCKNYCEVTTCEHNGSFNK